MKDPTFASPMAQHLGAYIALRRSLGFELRSQAHVLQKFDRVLQQEMSKPGPVTPTIEGVRPTQTEVIIDARAEIR